MMLRRTPSAFLSLHVFYGVDFVALCEGGQMLSNDLISNGAGNDGTLDAFFWSTALQKIRALGKKIHVKSVGSKTTLASIAAEIQVSNNRTIIICMDSDFDVYLANGDDEGYVVKTFGYSWENDTFQLPVLKSLFFDLLGETDAADKAWTRMIENYCALAIELNSITELEIEMKARGKHTILDRDNPKANLEFREGLPNLKADVKKAGLLANGFKRGPRCKIGLWPRGEMSFVFGKLVGLISYHLFREHAKRATKDFDVNYPTFCRLAISQLSRRIERLAGRIESHLVDGCNRSTGIQA